jgi:hypothetical protein
MSPGGSEAGLSTTYWISGAALLAVCGVFVLVEVSVAGGLFFLALAGLASWMALRRSRA